MEDAILNFQRAIDVILEPILIIMLLGTGVFLTVRLGFIQFRRLGHGVAVTMGKYDDPNDTGDVSHFQALTTALSATVGIGNIAGVALAIHFGGPGALFWMWVTAILGMATKFTEVTLAQKYRSVDLSESAQKTGSVAGGPMYYIERGLGKKWKPLAMFVAFFLMLTAILNGNAIQANTIADLMQAEFAIPVYITGAMTAVIVGLVILGGIKRIAKVTGIVAPVMAAIYVLGGLIVLSLNYTEVLPAFKLIFTEAFNPTAGIAGTGIGVFIQTMLWGVRRGLFSNEAGQGSAPIAHSAAKTDEPVSEGVVALLEPFIDTIIICTITGLVLISTGVWKQTTPTVMDLSSGDANMVFQKNTSDNENALLEIVIENGKPTIANGQFTWHDVAVERFYTNREQTVFFNGKILHHENKAIGNDGREYRTLFGPAVESGAPLTKLAFSQAMGKVGTWIIILSVFLFGISTSISWCYYGDRCMLYLGGEKMILPYKIVYVVFHFIGAVTSLNTIWSIGDTTLAFVTIPNVFALLMLSGVVSRMTKKYFEEKPYER